MRVLLWSGSDQFCHVHIIWYVLYDAIDAIGRLAKWSHRMSIAYNK